MAGGVTIRNNRTANVLTRLVRANSRALNRALVTMNAFAKRALAAETGLKQKSIDPRLRRDRATTEKLEVTLGMSGVPVRAIQLRAKQGPSGTTFGPRGKRTLIKSAFIAKGRRGRAVFLRTTPRRGPLEAQLGDPLAVVATREGLLEPMLDAGVTSYRKNAAHEVNRALGG